jgi:hypothetical protein
MHKADAEDLVIVSNQYRPPKLGLAASGHGFASLFLQQTWMSPMRNFAMRRPCLPGGEDLTAFASVNPIV